MKWEYRMVQSHKGSDEDWTSDLIQRLNNAGAQGWEAVDSLDSQAGRIILMKRQISN
jgi:hypothetical protein